MKRSGLAVFIISIFFFSPFLFAGRPLTTDDAETVEKGKFELEIGYDWIKNSDNTKNQEMGISLKGGLTDWMDLGISVPFIIEEENNKLNEWGKIEIGAKFSILKEKEKNPGISFTISGTPKPDEGDKIYGVNLILSKGFEKMAFHINTGTYSLKTASGNKNVFTYSGAIEYNILEKLNLVGEIAGEINDEKPVEILTGINYKLNENLIFDLGFAKGLNDNTPDWRITAGITLNW